MKALDIETILRRKRIREKFKKTKMALNCKPMNSAQPVYDRDVFLLIVVVALAICFNARDLFGFVQEHFPPNRAFRFPAYMVTLFSGPIVGLFSRRIASRITEFRDQ